MNSLIIGNGEIGKSLFQIIQGDIRDKEELSGGFLDNYDIIHICFPYNKDFIKQVKKYQKDYKPKYTVIHSSVPVGTSRKCNAIHSPCIGIHPHLAESLRTFIKFIGGGDSEIIQYFRRQGIKVYPVDKPETTELMKLLSTTKYSVDIEYTKEVKRICEDNGVPFEVWTLWTDNYNKGYNKLGYPEYTRPNLIPMKGEIGGHCCLPNIKLLKDVPKWKL